MKFVFFFSAEKNNLYTLHGHVFIKLRTINTDKINVTISGKYMFHPTVAALFIVASP